MLTILENKEIHLNGFSLYWLILTAVKTCVPFHKKNCYITSKNTYSTMVVGIWYG